MLTLLLPWPRARVLPTDGASHWFCVRLRPCSYMLLSFIAALGLQFAKRRTPPRATLRRLMAQAVRASRRHCIVLVLRFYFLQPSRGHASKDGARSRPSLSLLLAPYVSEARGTCIHYKPSLMAAPLRLRRRPSLLVSTRHNRASNGWGTQSSRC